VAAWKKRQAEQLRLWEERMFHIAPIRDDLQKVRELLRLIEGCRNEPIVDAMDRILKGALGRLEEAVAADSAYWADLLAQARGEDKG